MRQYPRAGANGSIINLKGEGREKLLSSQDRKPPDSSFGLQLWDIAHLR